MATTVKDFMKDKTIEKAAETIDALAERAKDALYDMSRRARDTDSGELRDNAWRMAGRARSQASGVASDLYQRGTQTAVAVRDQVVEQPWIALAVVGLFGLLIGYAMRRA
jgi:ElaB/YqjD/DUF883 family membrane-anchored ribosome-binding protein